MFLGDVYEALFIILLGQVIIKIIKMVRSEFMYKGVQHYSFEAES